MKNYSDYEYSSVSMSTDASFIENIEKIFADNYITDILESGSYLGKGSTVILADAVIKSGKAFPNFVTLEVDYELFKKARNNLKKYPFVKPIWGISIAKNEAIDFIKNDDAIIHHEQFEDIYIDNIKDPLNFYLNEVDGQLSKIIFRENVIKKIIKKLFVEKAPRFHENYFEKEIPFIKNKTPLILLDSAGGLGFLEFQTVCNLMKGNSFYLILDDIHHLKHFRSYEILKTNNDFVIIAEEKKHGWVIAKYL